MEECDFDRQFLFGEYVAIFHRYGLEKVYNSSFVLCKNCLAKVYDAQQSVEFP